MTAKSVLHLFGWDKKFVLPFRELIHQHFNQGDHKFIVYGCEEADALPPAPDTVNYASLRNNALPISIALHRADKVILHGLFDIQLLYLLSCQPWLLKKCYWVMWGADLYAHDAQIKDWRWKKNEWFRRFVFQRFGHLITHVKGDYELAQRWYGACGQWHECFMYPSNLYKEYPLQPKTHDSINIQVGNSAAPSNNHLEVLEKLKAFRDQDIKIYVPLSYGDIQYAKRVIDYGKDNFGEKFIPLTDFMPFDKYLVFMAKIDIAIFNHRRQQGLGNTTTLLGLGKKVYLRNDITPWKMFNDLGLIVFETGNIDLDPLDENIKVANREIIKDFFSEEMLIMKLNAIFKY